MHALHTSQTMDNPGSQQRGHSINGTYRTEPSGSYPQLVKKPFRACFSSVSRWTRRCARSSERVDTGAPAGGMYASGNLRHSLSWWEDLFRSVDTYTARTHPRAG